VHTAKTYAAVLVLVSACLTVLAQSTLAQSTLTQSKPGQPAPQAAIPQLDHFDVTQVDSSLDPCVDFYQYTCKKWIAKNPIPPDQANWWLGSKLMIWNQTVVRDILEKAANDDPKRGPSEQKIGDYYASCLNETEINNKGISAIRPELDRIDALRDKAQLAEALAHIHRITFALAAARDSGSGAALFGFGSGQDLDDASKVVAVVDQGGLGLPDRDYYLKPDQKSSELREKYVAHVQKTFELLGEPSAQAAADAKVVMDFETSLAKASLDIVARRDPANLNHKLSFQELQALTPAFSWDRYLANVNAPRTDHYLVMTPDFFKNVGQLIGTVPLENWKIYLRWQLVNASSSVLSTPFVDEKFDFYGRTLVGQKVQTPRWRRCMRSVDRDLAEALGQEFVGAGLRGR
jgi:putative endopeptidase